MSRSTVIRIMLYYGNLENIFFFAILGSFFVVVNCPRHPPQTKFGYKKAHNFWYVLRIDPQPLNLKSSST